MGAYNSCLKRLAAAGDYMLTSEYLHRLWRLTIDALALAATALLPRFWSAGRTKGSSGVDTFVQSWVREKLLVHTPVSRLPELIQKLESTPFASALVVAPSWTGAPWCEPLHKIAKQSIVLPAGSLRGLLLRAEHVKSWQAIAFHALRRDQWRDESGLQ